MQVVRQHHEGIDFEWIPLPGLSGGIPKSVDVIGEQMGATVEQVDREEPTSSRNKSATVVGHAASYQSDARNYACLACL